MTDTDIHSCGYYCDRPACIVAQRNELRNKLFSEQAVKTYSGGKPNYTQPIDREPILPGGGIGRHPDIPSRLIASEPEPVAWMNPNEESDGYAFSHTYWEGGVFTVPLYTALKKEWVDLTAAEVKILRNASNTDREFAALVIAKFKEKNGG